MRVVLDTVVLVRGLIDPFSWSGKLLFEWNGIYEWVVSPEIVEEYLGVLRRPGLANRFAKHPDRNLDAVLSLMSAATLVSPVGGLAICRDPADDKFLAAADTANADLIVSADHDLLSLGDFRGIRICPPENAVQELERWQSSLREKRD